MPYHPHPWKGTVADKWVVCLQDFPGIYTCTLNDRLDTVFDTIRKSRVHRLVVIDEASQLKGLLSLSDILDYTLNSPLGDQDEQ